MLSQEQSFDQAVPDNLILPLWGVGERNHSTESHSSSELPGEPGGEASRLCSPPALQPALVTQMAFLGSWAVPHTYILAHTYLRKKYLFGSSLQNFFSRSWATGGFWMFA